MWFLDLTKFRHCGNFFGDTMVSDLGIIAPGTIVQKAGRSTGITEGVVNGCAIQVWSDGCETKEIVVIGVPPPFANREDSGGILVLTGRDGTIRAAGEVIGMNLRNDLVCVTPIQTLLADAEQAFDGLRWARPLRSDNV